jgi:hypothetical protein
VSKTWKDSRDLRSNKFDRDRAKAQKKLVKQQRKLARAAQGDNDGNTFDVMSTVDPSWAD